MNENKLKSTAIFIIKRDCLFITLLGLLILFILNSHPFLKIPYDMWEHLSQIVNLYHSGTMFFYWPGYQHIGRGICWYYPWAIFFKLFGIDNFALWPAVIHRVQFGFAIFSNLFFSYTALRLLFPQGKGILEISLFSTVLWLFGNGLHSVVYHNAWIMWYSVNPQGMTISLMWLGNALLLIMAFDEKPRMSSKIVLAACCIAILTTIIFIHPLEGSYFLLHIGLVTLFLLGTIIKLIKKHYYWMVPCGVVSVAFVTFGAYYGVTKNLVQFPTMLTRIFTSDSPWSSFTDEILPVGTLVTQGLSHYPDAYSEIMLASLGLSVLLGMIVFVKRRSVGRVTLCVYIIVSAIFFSFIPLVKPIAGICGVLTEAGTVYRYIMASPWFLIIPILIYIIVNRVSERGIFLRCYFLVFISIALFFCVLSKYSCHHTLYRNVNSIMNSLSEEIVGNNYKQDEIDRLKQVISDNKGEIRQGRKPLYYVRGDWAHITNCFYRLPLYSWGKAGMEYKSTFEENRKRYEQYLENPEDNRQYAGLKLYSEYYIKDIDLPCDFPRDQSILDIFSLEKPSDRKVHVGEVDGAVGEITHDMRVIQKITALNEIARVQLLMANYNGRRNTKDVYLRIKQAPDATVYIAECKVNASEIEDNAWTTFKFDDVIRLDPYDNYFLCLESPDSYAENSVTVYKSKGDEYKNGTLLINGSDTGRDLCMKIWRGF